MTTDELRSKYQGLDKVSDIDIEYAGFLRDLWGLGRYHHFQNISQILYPRRVWHSWSESRFQALCERDFIGWTGCSSSGKTDDAAYFAVLWWLADPLGSAVVLTSTTGRMVRRRIWPVIRRLFHEYPGGADAFPGKLVDSQTIIRSRQPGDIRAWGDELHAIFAKPVAEGSTAKACADIQGMHPSSGRMLLIIDEATDTPEAVFKVVPNLRSNCVEFKVLCIGNAGDRYDPHGLFCEPLDGWESVSAEDFEWETTLKDDGKPGLCQHFDALQSPNWLLGEDRYPFLIRCSYIQTRLEAKESREFWKYDRGFWAPLGIDETVFTDALIAKSGATGPPFQFLGGVRVVAGCDPAFGGGDQACLIFARVGDLVQGGIGIQLLPPILLNIDARETAHTQLAGQIIEQCHKYNCQAENLSLDTTSEGQGLAAMLAVNWSNQVNRISFGSRASERLVSGTDSRRCKDAYNLRVCELWFTAREFIESGQVRGLTPSTIKQLCSRHYDETKGKKTLEAKKVMKKRTGYSPDEADALCLVFESVRNLGVTPEGIWSEIKADEPAAATDELALDEAFCLEGDLFEESVMNVY